jgi:hypothetical protein
MYTIMIRTIALAAAFAASAPLAPQLAQAAQTQVMIGTVEHVSTDNIKIKEQKSGQVIGFVLVPHFNQVFSRDGKTTQQMSALKPGTPVTVYYDQKALGARHADRILINGSVHGVKG